MNIEQQAAAWTEIRNTFIVNQTANGPGSTLEYTAPLREWLPGILKQFNIYTILDAPCGDLNWMGLIDLSEHEYTGWDVEPNQVALNQLRYPQHQFFVVNMLDPDLRWSAADNSPELFICRDFLFHLPNEDAAQVLSHIKESGARYLLSTNHPDADNEWFTRENLGDGMDDRPGYWYRPINLEAAPFNLTGRVAQCREDDGREMVLFKL